MILDLERFVEEERPYWDELEGLLVRIERRIENALDLEEARRFYYLYRRAASDLARMRTFAATPPAQVYLEALVARAYAEIHEIRSNATRFHPGVWIVETFPTAFRRHSAAFLATVLITLAGMAFGAFAVASDSAAKAVLLPFEHLLGNPKERVAKEEASREDRHGEAHATFAAFLMNNNIRVSIFALALGMTFGFGTLVLLFYNGVILGAVVFDYVRAGESVFLAGWLLPHGSIEIPSILLAGQAGFVLGHALLGYGSAETLGERLRAVTGDLVTLIFGVALLLVWAGIIESFVSQYHGPVLYPLKIAFGVAELTALTLYLSLAGRRRTAHG